MMRPAKSNPAARRDRGRAAAVEFEQECVDFFAEVAHVFRAPPSAGQIYGLLYASPEPLSFSDIVERLGISKGSASQGLRLLRTTKAVTVVETDDVRREYFVPELGLRKLMGGVLHERLEPLLAMGAVKIDRLKHLAKESPTTGNFQLKQVKQLETWRARLMLVLPVLQSFLGP